VIRVQLADTPAESEFRARARQWLEAHAPEAPSIPAEPSDEDVKAWRSWSRTLAEAGYAGLTWPAEVGGPARSYAELNVWYEERARSGVPDHFGIIGLDMAAPTIMAWGAPSQKQRYLPSLLRADEIWCQGFSEPGSGSDLADARTSAVLEGDDWIVNGQKVWSSFSGHADWCLLLVRTDPSVAKHKGLSYLLVDMHSPGVEVRPLRQITGDPEFGEIFFTDVRVPRHSMLGQPGDGWAVAMTTLDHERGTHGVALAAELNADLRELTALLRRRDANGERPADNPFVRDRLTELWVDVQALRITNLRSLSELARSGKPGPAGSIAKLRWSELNQRLATLATDVLGPDALRGGAQGIDGGRWTYRRMRTRGNSIEAGTSEVLRNIIAERVIGLPRSR
jgi:alkylation response protein AidB-like acyl-CoA dehydrogenase